MLEYEGDTTHERFTIFKNGKETYIFIPYHQLNTLRAQSLRVMEQTYLQNKQKQEYQKLIEISCLWSIYEQLGLTEYVVDYICKIIKNRPYQH